MPTPAKPEDEFDSAPDLTKALDEFDTAAPVQSIADPTKAEGVRQDYSDAGTSDPGVTAKHEQSTMESFRGGLATFLSGATFNWADRLAGLEGRNKAIQQMAKPEWNQTKQEFGNYAIRLSKEKGIPLDQAIQQAWDDDIFFKEAKDKFTDVKVDFDRENPKTAFGLQVAGGVTTGGITPKNKLASAGVTLAEGALSGAGASKDTKDMPGNAVVGAGVAGGIRVLTQGAAKPLTTRFGNWLGRKAVRAEIAADNALMPDTVYFPKGEELRKIIEDSFRPLRPGLKIDQNEKARLLKKVMREYLVEGIPDFMRPSRGSDGHLAAYMEAKSRFLQNLKNPLKNSARRYLGLEEGTPPAYVSYLTNRAVEELADGSRKIIPGAREFARQMVDAAGRSPQVLEEVVRNIESTEDGQLFMDAMAVQDKEVQSIADKEAPKDENKEPYGPPDIVQVGDITQRYYSRKLNKTVTMDSKGKVIKEEDGDTRRK